MKAFMDQDFLLESEPARDIYQAVAGLPVIDFHCHLNAAEIAQDKQYESITELWLGGDHYKWRAMRFHGVEEAYITGNADARNKFRAWAQTLENCVGNPLYHWSHMELKRFFGVSEPLTGTNADAIYERCNSVLKGGLSAKKLIFDSAVRAICTTDDPCDTLEHHRQIKAQRFEVIVAPSFRPDKALNIDHPGFKAYVAKLGNRSGVIVRTFDDLCGALLGRLETFCALGCKVSDHALEQLVFEPDYARLCDRALTKALAGEPVSPQEAAGFRTAMLIRLAGAYTKNDVSMQLHVGCMRNVSSVMFNKLGPDAGYDAILETGDLRKLAMLFDELEKSNCLPRTILYSLDQNSNRALMSICTAFGAGKRGYVQLGPAWWFNDTKDGMEKQLKDFADLGCLGDFVGMLTDSRSFLSYARHDYFRRILSNYLGGLIEKGEHPADMERVGRIAANIAYHNAAEYFGF